MSVLPELWSEQDDVRLTRFETALATGALAQALLALEGADERSRRRALSLIQAWGERLQHRCRAGKPRAVAWAEHARVLLAQELQLGVEREERLSPYACGLASALERKRGIPHVLSAIWMLVCAEAGVPAAGIDLPLYFLVQVGDDASGRVICDPFCLGRRLKISDCRRIVTVLTEGRATWDPKLLTPVGPDVLLDGVLRHVLFCYDQLGNTTAQYKTLRFVSVLHPDRGDIQMALARFALRLGARELARSTLQAIPERFPKLADEVSALLKHMKTNLRILH